MIIRDEVLRTKKKKRPRWKITSQATNHSFTSGPTLKEAIAPKQEDKEQTGERPRFKSGRKG